MKVIKAMKNLKFWSRKRKKKDHRLLTDSPPPPPPSRPAPPPPPPPPSHHPIYSQYEPLLPSAPPLPPWLEYDDHLQFQESEENSPPNSTSESHFSPPQEIYTTEISPEELRANFSYQQYMVSNPVYDNSIIVPEIKKLERASGAFGCVVSFGAHLVRCVFPCFYIRQVDSSNKETCIIS